jgi:hypothetical protein
MMFERHTALLALFALAWPAPTLAQDENPPPPKKEGVQIVFLPPPMEGTLSLGVYDKAGKLVRTLHREATDREFKKGINGLITHWDGRDDAGQPLPPGKYAARGWMIGDLKVEGVAYHGNDWLSDENTPRFARVLTVQNSGRDEIHIVLRAIDGAEHTLGWKLAKPGAEPAAHVVEAALDAGTLVIRKGAAVTPVMMEEGEKAVASSVGRDGRVWAIVESPQGREVRAYSESGEFLRRLAYAKEDPSPRQIAASRWSETIFLLEENDAEQRLRALALGTPKADGSTAWKTVYQKRIVFTDTFAAAAPELGRTPPPQAAAEIKVRTKPNPLLQHTKTEARFQVSADAKGALLASADGLPLIHLTDTPALKWAVLVQEKEGVVLFEGDGAVVGEFKLGAPSNVMAFEAGDYVLER